MRGVTGDAAAHAHELITKVLWTRQVRTVRAVHVDHEKGWGRQVRRSGRRSRL
jgi:hypothetical protein